MHIQFLTVVSLFLFFSAGAQKRYDLLINEIMADPDPSAGSPAVEWIELYNRSSETIPLRNWTLGDASSESAPFPPYDLAPGAYLVLCASSSVNAFSVATPVLAVGRFPSLNNDKDQLLLYNTDGDLIHSLLYTSDMYGNSSKAAGGWSLEMIDVAQACRLQDNWTASTDIKGATPGRKNAAARVLEPTTAQLKTIYFPDSMTIRIQYDHQLADPIEWMQTVYELNPTLGMSILGIDQTVFTELELQFEKPFQPQTGYFLLVSGVVDGCGNAVPAIKQTVALPEKALSGDIRINELLFNPTADAADYIELYNSSKKTIDLQSLRLANRDASGRIGNSLVLTDQPDYLAPGGYRLLTTDTLALRFHYLLRSPEAVREAARLPSLPDDQGNCVLLSLDGDIIDEIAYSSDWHFALLASKEGVSLERMDPLAATQDRSNWHSAASSSGGGTPGYQNSQYRVTEPEASAFSIQPAAFSPDNDGYHDTALFQYGSTQAGWMGNLIIYDAQARPIRYLAKSQVLGTANQWTWDGLDEQQHALPVGQYLVTLEVFNLEGKRKMMKKVVVLAGKI